MAFWGKLVYWSIFEPPFRLRYFRLGESCLRQLLVSSRQQAVLLLAASCLRLSTCLRLSSRQQDLLAAC